MTVPVLAGQVLGAPAPDVGEPQEPGLTAAWLRAAIHACDEYVSAGNRATQTLAMQVSRSALALEHRAEQNFITRARELTEQLRPCEFAFRQYGEHIEGVRERARAIEIRVLDGLREIQRARSALEILCLRSGVPAPHDWRIPPRLSPPVLFGTSSEYHVDGGGPSGQGLLRHFEGEWRELALRWTRALEDVRQAEREWRHLQERREAVERHLVSVLRAFTVRAAPGRSEYGSTLVLAGGGQNLTSHASMGTKNLPKPIDRLYRSQFGNIVLGRPMPAAEVSNWWFQLSLAERRAVSRAHPEVIGNLDGVPLTARVRANALGAKHIALREGLSEAEANYWREVANGSVKLIVSDPENSRIVEMIGSPGPKTDRAIIYVPGTGAQMKDFYEGEAQQVAHYLVERSKGSAVAFVYKDGYWVSWAGPNRNTDYEFLAGLGAKLEHFEREVLGNEPRFAHASREVIGHSAGMTVISGAEIAGARFDRVISLGGSYMLREWEPNPGTEYHHFQYDNDIINRIDGGRLDTPHELTETYIPHIFDSEGKAEMTSHGRVADGPETNGAVLAKLSDMLRGEQQ